VIPPSSGAVRLLDRDPSDYGQRREIRRRLGYLPQNLGYYPNFTVYEFIEYFALLKEIPPARVSQAVAAAIEHVDLGERARAKPRTLSGGMLRRVGIGQAIVNDPQLLLLDEPTAGLDPEQRMAFRTLLREIGERATMVVSTHLVEDVGAACDQVALLHDGQIVFCGTPEALTDRGHGHAVGDAPLERGYAAVLAEARMNRLLRLEARRSALLPLFPGFVLLLWLSPIAQHLRPVALWPDRSTDLQSTIHSSARSWPPPRLACSRCAATPATGAFAAWASP